MNKKMCPLGGKIESEGKKKWERREPIRHHLSTTTASAEALSIWLTGETDAAYREGEKTEEIGGRAGRIDYRL